MMKLADDTVLLLFFLTDTLFSPQVNQVNGSGLPWCAIFSDSASHRGEARRMYSKDVGGGQ